MTNDKTQELKPCPFCGGEAETFKHIRTGRTWVECQHVGCGMLFKTRRPLKIWQTRTNQATVQIPRDVLEGIERAFSSVIVHHLDRETYTRSTALDKCLEAHKAICKEINKLEEY